MTIFSKKPKLNLVEFKPQELEDRSEWLFWSALIHTKESLEQLKDIFEFDDYKWTFLKKDALFEILLWEFAGSVAVLKEKLLSPEQIEKLIGWLIFYIEIISPKYKDYQIIDIFSNYLVFAKSEKDHKKLRIELDSYLIERLCKLFNKKVEELNTKEIADLVFMKFPFGWMLGLDAFSFVEINQIQNANLQARQTFRSEITNWGGKKKEGETEEETKKRKEWDENLKNFNEAVGGLKEELDDEIKRRNYVEKSLKKFLLSIEASQPLKEQITNWIKKEGLQLTDKEIEKFIELSYDKFNEKQADKDRKKLP